MESDGQKISKDYKSALDNLQKARSKYITLSKEADKAEAEHTSGKGNVQMKPAQLAKVLFLFIKNHTFQFIYLLFSKVGCEGFSSFRKSCRF